MLTTATELASKPGSADWSLLFRDVRHEHGFQPLRVEGRLPADLEGTLYRNGPGFFTSPEGTARHPFDGEGVISAVRLSAGRALGAVRAVATDSRQRERAAGRTLYNGYDKFAPGLLRFNHRLKPNANTHVVPWRGSLLALWEGARPVALCPATLETLGPVAPTSEIRDAFSAHPHRVRERHALYNFGLENRLGGRGVHTHLSLFELPDEGPARKLGEVPIAGPTMVHDFIVTRRHFIFFLAPIEIALWPVLTTTRPFSECVRFVPERGSEIVIVPIDEPRRVTRIQTDAFHVWHFANAYEDGDELDVSFVRFPNLDSLRGLSSLWRTGRSCGYEGELTRARIALTTGRVRFETVSDRYVEFPRVHPELESERARYVYTSGFASRTQALTRQVHGSIARTDLDTSTEVRADFGPREHVSEPVFVPRPNASHEGDGYVLTLVLDTGAALSYVAVLDAAQLDRGPLAKIWFDQALPMSFHGSFVPA